MRKGDSYSYEQICNAMCYPTGLKISPAVFIEKTAPYAAWFEVQGERFIARRSPRHLMSI